MVIKLSLVLISTSDQSSDFQFHELFGSIFLSLYNLTEFFLMNETILIPEAVKDNDLHALVNNYTKTEIETVV